MNTPRSAPHIFSRVGFVLLLFSMSAAIEPASAAGSPHDYDGDGRAEFALYASGSGGWHILRSSSFSAVNVQFGWDESRPAPGDYDGDGCADPAVYHEETGCWYVLLSGSGYALASLQFGASGYRPVSGDYDGDGRSDAALFHRDTGTWYILRSSTWTVSILQFGAAAMRPLSGDYDGDGKSDLALYERDTGTWYVLNSASWSLAMAQFGSIAARPTPADYDGDGKTDLAVFERAAGSWYIFESASGLLKTMQFGSTTSRPAPADYDGDGKSDIAVFDRESGEWNVAASGSAELWSLQFGSNEMAPIPGYSDGAIAGLVYLAFGDSITYGCGSSSDGPDTGYPAILERKLAPAFGGHFHSDNAGVPGEITAEGVDRFEAALSDHDPDVVLVMEGTNDEFFEIPYDETEANLRAMVAVALSRGIGVIIATIPPVITNRYRDRSAQMALIQGFNPLIYSIAADYGIPVAQVHEAITAVPEWETLLMDQPTANHPNGAGYEIVADAFFSAMKEGINSGLFY